MRGAPGNSFTPKVIWSIVEEAAADCGLASFAPHDLRRTCARFRHPAQIQFLLGHVSIEDDGGIPWLQAAAPKRGE
jgi:integrase